MTVVVIDRGPRQMTYGFNIGTRHVTVVELRIERTKIAYSYD